MSQYPHGGQSEDDRMIEDVLRHAEPRRQPGADARDRAYRALRGEWLELTTERRRRRRTVIVGIAASVVAALGIGILAWQPAPDAVMAASVQRLSGDDIAINGAHIPAGDLLASRLADGDRLATGKQSRIAVRWKNSGSIRIDEESRVEFVSADTVALLQGGVYYDSRQFGHESEPSALIRVDTPIGRITHRGTQFLASTDGDNVIVSVREGTVHVRGATVDVSVAAGETFEIGTDGHSSRTSITPYAARWQWAAEVAPTMQLDGRKITDMLQWIARETGRDVYYRSDRARTRAAEDKYKLFGFEPLGPREALNTIPIASDLLYDIDEARIVVDVRDPG